MGVWKLFAAQLHLQCMSPVGRMIISRLESPNDIWYCTTGKNESCLKSCRGKDLTPSKRGIRPQDISNIQFLLLGIIPRASKAIGLCSVQLKQAAYSNGAAIIAWCSSWGWQLQESASVSLQLADDRAHSGAKY